jgi:hypothetical protein
MMTKKEIFAAVQRFRADPDRVISEQLFAELAGISETFFHKIFRYGEPFGPRTQLRLERAIKAIENGEVAVMQKGRHRFVTYRREPRIDYKRNYGLTMKGGKIGLKLGMTNANCYTGRTFKEEIEG